MAARRCHALVSVADAMTELMVQGGIAPREKFTTIYSGMDVEPFLHADQHRQRVRDEFGFDAGDVVVGKIARLFHLKGHADVVEAARSVVSRLPNVRFLFVGDGILREPLARRIEAANLSRHFHVTGLVSPERVAELIGAMDVVVHASLREGLARALPQALIAQRPVISYDVDGAREVVVDGVTGRLVPPRNVPVLTAAICELAGDPELRDRLGREGRRRCVDVFKADHMTAELRRLYQRIA
jgi:glycosyltransferase involved in cell wall biosynthesis